jgi:hypothetical protein
VADMKISDKLLNTLNIISLVVAALAWLAAIIILGILSKSFAEALWTILACAAFITGFYLYTHPKREYYKQPPAWLKLRMHWLLMGLALILLYFYFLDLNIIWIWWLAFCLLQLLPLLLFEIAKKNQ